MRKTPKLRFPDFYGEWNLKPLNEIAEQVKRKAQKPIDNILTISASRGFIKQEDRFSQVIAGNSLENYTLLKRNEMSYNKGNSKLFKFGCVFAQKEFEEALVPNVYISFNIIDGNPLFYELLFSNKYLDKELRKIISSTARMDGLLNVNRDDFMAIQVPVTNSFEQDKIVVFFTLIDTKLKKQQNKISYLEDCKKGLMRKIFSQEIRLKNGNGEDYPEWEEKKVDEICEVKGGKRLPKGYALMSENTGYPYITVSDMHIGGINPNNIKYVPPKAANYIKSYKITTEDLFISVAGTLGVVGFVPESLNNANLTENADKLTNIRCNIRYLYQYLNSERIQKKIEDVKTNNAQPKLSIEQIKKFPILIPDIKEQEKIADILSKFDEKIEMEKEKLELMKEFKRGLLQQMFV